MVPPINRGFSLIIDQLAQFATSMLIEIDSDFVWGHI